jgi:hypothetical protein
MVNMAFQPRLNPFWTFTEPAMPAVDVHRMLSPSDAASALRALKRSVSFTSQEKRGTEFIHTTFRPSAVV